MTTLAVLAATIASGISNQMPDTGRLTCVTLLNSKIAREFQAGNITKANLDKQAEALRFVRVPFQNGELLIDLRVNGLDKWQSCLDASKALLALGKPTHLKLREMPTTERKAILDFMTRTYPGLKDRLSNPDAMLGVKPIAEVKIEFGGKVHTIKPSLDERQPDEFYKTLVNDALIGKEREASIQAEQDIGDRSCVVVLIKPFSSDPALVAIALLESGRYLEERLRHLRQEYDVIAPQIEQRFWGERGFGRPGDTFDKLPPHVQDAIASQFYDQFGSRAATLDALKSARLLDVNAGVAIGNGWVGADGLKRSGFVKLAGSRRMTPP